MKAHPFLYSTDYFLVSIFTYFYNLFHFILLLGNFLILRNRNELYNFMSYNFH